MTIFHLVIKSEIFISLKLLRTEWFVAYELKIWRKMSHLINYRSLLTASFTLYCCKQKF